MQRKSLILFFFLFLYNNFYSQNLLDSTSAWFGKCGGWDGVCHFYTSYNSTTVVGDTIINGLNYYKLHSWTLDSLFGTDSVYCQDEVNIIDYGIRYWREDAGVFYAYDLNSSSDVVVYDFNISIGDTIYKNYPYPGCDTPMIVMFIDSIQFNGNFRRRFNIMSGSKPAGNIIEGIGHNSSGLFAPDCPGEIGIEGDCSFSCYKQGIDSTGNDCSWAGKLILLLSTNQSLSQYYYNIFPNPACITSEFFLYKSKTADLKISIYDVFGKVVRHFFIPREIDQFQFSAEEIGTGLFFATIIDGSNRLAGSQKIVIVK